MTRKQPTASRGESERLQRARCQTSGSSRRAVRAQKEEREWREKKSSIAVLTTEDTQWEDASTQAGEDGSSPQASCSTPPSAREERGSPWGSLSGPPTAVERTPMAEERQAVGRAGELSQPLDRPAERAAEADPPGAALASPQATPAGISEEELVEQGLARLLMQMAAMAPSPPCRTPFESKRAPGISVKDYVARVVRTSRCCQACVVASLVYLDRLMKNHPHIVISPLTCHRLVLISIVVAVKFNDDTYFSNHFYSKVGGVQLVELNSLERYFLKLVDFKLSVSPQEYDLYRSMLLRALQMDAGSAPPIPVQAA